MAPSRCRSEDDGQPPQKRQKTKASPGSLFKADLPTPAGSLSPPLPSSVRSRLTVTNLRTIQATAAPLPEALTEVCSSNQLSDCKANEIAYSTKQSRLLRLALRLCYPTWETHQLWARRLGSSPLARRWAQFETSQFSMLLK